MEILYIPSCGFGDVSFSTTWPKILAERGHTIDVFLRRYTGNPFHANPYIRNMFIVLDREIKEAIEKIKATIESHSYDMIIIPNTICFGTKEMVEAIRNYKNVYIPFFDQQPECVKQMSNILGFNILVWTKPEWYFTNQELKYITDKNLKNHIIFYPMSSDFFELSRNISFNLIEKCSNAFNNIVITHGGGSYLPINDLKRIEGNGKIKLLWEDYNCFKDEYGHPLGKQLALTSECMVSVHGWSGSFTISMGYNKPYVVVVPTDKIRCNALTPYLDTAPLFIAQINRARNYGCLNPSAWCITEDENIIEEAIRLVLDGKTAIYNKTCEFIS